MKGDEPLGERRPFVAAVFNTSPDTVEMLRVVLTHTLLAKSSQSFWVGLTIRSSRRCGRHVGMRMR